MKRISMLKTNKFFQLISLIVLLSFSGCSRLDSFLDAKDRVNYQSNNTVKPLDFPPDLTAPEFDKEFELPSATTNKNTVSMRSGGLISNNSVTPTSFSVGPAANQPSQSTASRAGRLSTLTRQGNKTVLRVNDTYPRSLILMDIMLERTNFTVLSRNSAAGLYTVQYNGNEGIAPKGWFSRAKNAVGLSDNNNSLAKGNKYQINIKNQQGAPLVSFKTEAGQDLPEATHQKLLTLLDNAFNR